MWGGVDPRLNNDIRVGTFEDLDCVHCPPSVLILHWISSLKHHAFQVTTQMIELIHATYNRGFGSRPRAPWYGINLYLGTPSTERVIPTPAAGPRTATLNQYFQQQYIPKYQPICEKYVSQLVHGSFPVGMVADPMTLSLLHYILRQETITSTRMVTCGYTNGGPFGFANAIHCDDNDAYDNDVQEKI